MSDPKYKITFFRNRFETQGKLIERTLEEIYLGFKDKVKRTNEKLSEFLKSDLLTQSNIKDIGGFIGGESTGNRRTTGVRITRQLLTLDADPDVPNVLPYLKRNIAFYCIIHSTHKHSPEKNRFRIIAPLSRPVSEDEYEALGRRIAYHIEYAPKETMSGLFDETTFQPGRLMFLPTVSSDGEYICELLNLNMLDDEQPVIDVDNILGEYLDKNNAYEWFVPEKTDGNRIGRTSLQNKNPLKATGMVGAFNRTYSISEAIDKFLPSIYKLEKNGRYTYLNGDSHGGGIILNNDTIFYSHHGTDPANLYYRSSFDLVRIHLFGSFDKGYTPEKESDSKVLEKTESFAQMVAFCRRLPEVVANSDNNIALNQRLEQQEDYVKKNFEDTKKEVKEVKEEEADYSADVPQLTEEDLEKLEEAKKINDANSVVVQQDDPTVATPEDKSWLVKLEGIKSIPAKLDIIFSNDGLIGNLFYYDTFKENICFLRKPYWRQTFVEGQALQDKDMAHIRVDLDKVYGIRGEKIIDDAVIVEADKIQKNKVLEWFESLTWDGKPRLEFFFHDFFKVTLNPFTRVALKHWLVGAVSRIYQAGAPLDLILVIKGKQGIGKSLFLKRLATIDFSRQGDHLYSDTKIDFDHAKDSYEQLEGIWIYEWKELAGMNMSEQESIKAFVDKTEDKFRRSYGRRNVEIKRRVAFAGSTNEKTPLRDRTGNRRFLVIESPLQYQECYVKDMTKFTQEYRDQMLAEAISLYKSGFDIFNWSPLEETWWDKSNSNNLAENDFIGTIESYLKMLRPRTWYSMSNEEMLDYIKNYNFENHHPNGHDWDGAILVLPERVCIQEIWRIALHQRDITINRYHRELISQAFDLLGWEVSTKQKQRFGVFGTQFTIEPKKQSTDGSEEDVDLPF